MRIGAIEAGGTKFVVGIGDETGEILERKQFPTERPEDTLPHVFEFFNGKDIEVMGVGSFGPLVIDGGDEDYGTFLSTPKVAWSHFPLLRHLREGISVPIALDTDVNAALYGEMYWGNARNLDSCVYITVGTGIGGGVLAENQVVHGMLHPEVGHMFVERHPDDEFAGACPYHRNCLEGLASGPAIEKRWGRSSAEALEDHRAFTIEAFYLAQAVINLRMVLSTKRIIFGGGVMKHTRLFDEIRHQVSQLMGNYMAEGSRFPPLDEYVVAPGLGDDAGLKGAIALALNTFRRNA